MGAIADFFSEMPKPKVLRQVAEVLVALGHEVVVILLAPADKKAPPSLLRSLIEGLKTSMQQSEELTTTTNATLKTMATAMASATSVASAASKAAVDATAAATAAAKAATAAAQAATTAAQAATAAAQAVAKKK